MSNLASTKESLISSVLKRIPDESKRDAIHDLIYDSEGKSLPVVRDCKETDNELFRWRQFVIFKAALIGRTGETRSCCVKRLRQRVSSEDAAFENTAQLLEEGRFLHHLRGTGACPELQGIVLPQLHMSPYEFGLALQINGDKTLHELSAGLPQEETRSMAVADALNYALQLTSAVRKVHQKMLLLNFISASTVLLGCDSSGRLAARFLHIGESSYRGGVRAADISLPPSDGCDAVLAPEVRQGQKTSQASDVFLLAGCFRHLAAACGNKELEVLSQMMSVDKADSRLGVCHLSTILQFLIRRESYVHGGQCSGLEMDDRKMLVMINEETNTEPVDPGAKGEEESQKPKLAKKPRGQTSPARPFPHKPKLMLDAVLDYMSEKQAHLTFKKGQRIYQIKAPDTEDGLAYGFIDNGPFRRKMFGYFPLDRVVKATVGMNKAEESPGA